MMSTLLPQRDLARQLRRGQVFEETRRRLKAALAELLPGQPVIVLGSLTRRDALFPRLAPLGLTTPPTGCTWSA